MKTLKKIVFYLMIVLCIATVPIGFIWASDYIGGCDFDDISNYVTDNRFYWLKDPAPCQYPGCEEPSTSKVSYTVPADSSSKIEGRRLVLAMGIDNAANFMITGSGFSGTLTDGGYFVPSTHTYIIPQNDGNFRVEKRTTFEHRDRTRSFSLKTLDISGYYCDEHAPLAENTLKAELITQFVWKNGSFWLGLVAFLILFPATLLYYHFVYCSL